MTFDLKQEFAEKILKARTKMSDIRKEQEREELHKTIWGIADDLRIRLYEQII